MNEPVPGFAPGFWALTWALAVEQKVSVLRSRRHFWGARSVGAAPATSSRNSARFSRVRDLARTASELSVATLHARSLAPPEKARGFGMTLRRGCCPTFRTARNPSLFGSGQACSTNSGQAAGTAVSMGLAGKYIGPSLGVRGARDTAASDDGRFNAQNAEPEPNRLYSSTASTIKVKLTYILSFSAAKPQTAKATRATGVAISSNSPS